MAKHYDDLREDVKRYVRDREGIVQEADFNAAIDEAVGYYSDKYPYRKLKKETGDGTTIEWDAESDFYEDKSAIIWVSYPAEQTGERQPQLLEVKKGYDLIRTATGELKLRLLLSTPSSSEYVEYEYTTIHTVTNSASTLSGAAAERRVSLAAASLCCEQIAAHYAQFKSSVIDGDIADFGDKARIFSERAEQLRGRSGLSDVMQMADKKFAVATRNFYPSPPWGRGRSFVVHKRGRG